MEPNSPLIPLRETEGVHVEAGTPGRVAVALDADATAEFLVLQDDPAGLVRETVFDITLAAGASLDMVFLSLGGQKTANRIRVSLDGERAACNLGGLCLADGDQQMDFDIL